MSFRKHQIIPTSGTTTSRERAAFKKQDKQQQQQYSDGNTTDSLTLIKYLLLTLMQSQNPRF